MSGEKRAQFTRRPSPSLLTVATSYSGMARGCWQNGQTRIVRMATSAETTITLTPTIISSMVVKALAVVREVALVIVSTLIVVRRLCSMTQHDTFTYIYSVTCYGNCCCCCYHRRHDDDDIVRWNWSAAAITTTLCVCECACVYVRT